MATLKTGFYNRCAAYSFIKVRAAVYNLQLLLLSARRSGGTAMPHSRGSTGNINRMRSLSGVTGDAGGGLSVTGSLSNFSLYIFHPYGGGGQKKTSLAALENTFRKSALRTGL